MKRPASRPPYHLLTLLALSVVVALLLWSAAAASGATLTVTWDANTEEDLAGYRVYCGTASGVYGESVAVDKETTSCQLGGLASGETYYVAVTAFDTSGNESDFSEEAWASTGGAATYGLVTGVSPAGSGTVGWSPSSSSYADGTQVTLTAAPASGYRFDHWGGAASGTSNPVTITMDANKTVTAYFVPVSYTLTVGVSGSGSVSRSPNSSSYAAGTQVTLTAAPASGYRFDHWGGAVTGTANPAVVTMDANKTVTAYFVPVSYTLTVNVSGSGTVSRSPSASSYAAGTQVTLTATPGWAYRFDRWEGDVTTTSNPVTITMNGDKSVTARFVWRWWWW